MKKILTILGLASVLTLGVGGVAEYISTNTQGVQPVVASAEETWDVTETFDSVASIDDNFDFYFCSSQNARRSDEFAYSWDLQDGAAYRTGNVDTAADTVNIAIMTYVGDVYDDFEMSVDFKAGSLTPYWPVIGIRQQIPGKNYTVEGGGTGVFMQQNGKITFWGPITNGIKEWDIPEKGNYYPLEWHTMRIRAEGSGVTVWVDDNVVANITVNATDYTKGYISLISVNNDCAFDNFKVRGLGSSGAKGNEENLYEYADFGQSLDDIIANGYTGVILPEEGGSGELAAPTVKPASQQIMVENGVEDVIYKIAYNNGVFQSLKMNGLEVDEGDYSRTAATLTLHKDYVEKLPVGENVFTLTTTGGTVEFTLTIQRETVVFTDANRIKKFSTTDVSFKMDFGVGALSKVTLGGAILPETAYSYQNGALRIKRDFLSTLGKGVYEVFVYDTKGTFVDCMITVGMETAEAYVINNDSFVVTTNGYGESLTLSTKEGLYGNGAGVSSNGAGTLLVFDKDNIPYNFVHGTTYSITTYFKFENTVAGTSSFLDLMIPIYFKTNSGNADIGYIRYSTENGYYFYPESKCVEYEFKKVGDWYRLAVSFTYESSWNRLEMPVWMVTDFVMDNFVLAPVSGSVKAMKLPETVAVPKATQKDVTMDCATKVLGINYGENGLTANEYTYANGVLTLKKEFLSALSAGKHIITVYGENSYQAVEINVNQYSFSVSGNTAYTVGGGDMTVTVETDGFSLSEASVKDSKKTLTKNADYTISGNELTVKESYLQTVSGKETLTIVFGEGAEVDFVVTSNKLLSVDFENGGLDKGFAYNMTQELTDGKTGNGMRLTNTTTATMLSLGGEFYNIEFVEGRTYTFSFDLKLEDVATDNNLVIAGNSCWMPITFGSLKDVTFLRVVKTGDTYKISNETQQVGINASVGTMDENGFVTISFTFVPKAGCTNLTFDVWMPATIVIDNLTLIAH